MDALSNAVESLRRAFENALGQAFGRSISPPVASDEASSRECCEVIWLVLGEHTTPTRLATLSELQMLALAVAFGRYFNSVPPSLEQIKEAIERTLFRWPAGSLGEIA